MFDMLRTWIVVSPIHWENDCFEHVLFDILGHWCVWITNFSVGKGCMLSYANLSMLIYANLRVLSYANLGTERYVMSTLLSFVCTKCRTWKGVRRIVCLFSEHWPGHSRAPYGHLRTCLYGRLFGHTTFFDGHTVISRSRRGSSAPAWLKTFLFSSPTFADAWIKTKTKLLLLLQ